MFGTDLLPGMDDTIAMMALASILDDDGEFEDVFEHRGLKFHRLPDSDLINVYDDQVSYVCIHEDKVLLLVFTDEEVCVNYDDSGDVTIESREDLDRFLDTHVFGSS